MELHLLLTLLPYLICSGFWGHVFQLRTEFKRELGGSGRAAVGLDSATWRTEGGKCLTSEMVWSELTLASLRRWVLWVSHCEHSLHWKVGKKQPSWCIHRGCWVTDQLHRLNYLKMWKGNINFFSPAVKTTVFPDVYGLCKNYFFVIIIKKVLKWNNYT